NGDRYEICDVADEFPENGCIRIVPDKNESSRFKARMRRMGGYCEVDLREHPDENDKIRPNKNYRGEESEPNAYIIYSDVVREPAEGRMVEIVQQEAPADSENIALTMRTPRTSRVVMLAGGAVAENLWSHAPFGDIEGGVAFSRAEGAVDLNRAQRFDIPGFDGEPLSFLIAEPGGLLYAAPASAPRARIERPEPVAAQARVEAAAELEPEIEKPWISRDARIAPQAIDHTLSPRDQAIAAQTGINPRRGSSLKEIIEEKWRRSRIDQLGHPVPGCSNAVPVISPVDRALDAVREAWAYADARRCLAQALLTVEGLSEAVAVGKDTREELARAERLSEYEASRAALMAEIEGLRKERETTEQEMIARMREENAEEIAERTARVNALEVQEAQLRARAEDARRVAESAERAIAELTEEKLGERLSAFAVNCRAVDLIANIRTGGAAEVRAAGEALKRVDEIGVKALAELMRAQFAGAGFALTGDEAVNILACFALGDAMIFSGPTGCGKTAYAQLLLGALGLSDAGRVRHWRAGDEDWAAGADAESDLPQVVFADDVNAARRGCGELLHAMGGGIGIKAVMTVQDSADGHAMPARLLDRAFLLRLRAEEAGGAWGRAARVAAKSEFVLTASALRSLFLIDARNIAPQVAARMEAIRAALAGHDVRISRRALDAMWRYCAAVTPHLTMTPLEAFDLAFSQRALPAVVALAGVDALHALPNILEGMPRSLALLAQPLAIAL
ncbi:MAG: hypothetical protein ACOYI5_09785, partial [Christensenellales bacterium]